MVNRFAAIGFHNALALLRASFGTPKILTCCGFLCAINGHLAFERFDNLFMRPALYSADVLLSSKPTNNLEISPSNVSPTLVCHTVKWLQAIQHTAVLDGSFIVRRVLTLALSASWCRHQASCLAGSFALMIYTYYLHDN
jgi:hypothetical protein